MKSILKPLSLVLVASTVSMNFASAGCAEHYREKAAGRLFVDQPEGLPAEIPAAAAPMMASWYLLATPAPGLGFLVGATALTAVQLQRTKTRRIAALGDLIASANSGAYQRSSSVIQVYPFESEIAQRKTIKYHADSWIGVVLDRVTQRVIRKTGRAGLSQDLVLQAIARADSRNAFCEKREGDAMKVDLAKNVAQFTDVVIEHL